MPSTKSVWIILAAMLALLGHVLPATGQTAQPAPAQRDLDTDAAPTPESGAPDPLAPQKAEGPAPLAPGAAAVIAGGTASPGTVDPIVIAVRQLLAALPQKRNAGDREDLAAALAYYETGTDTPIWAGKDGLTIKGRQALDELGKADDWGLSPAAFELPSAIDPSPTTDALAEAESKLALAVLKYARQARGGRLDPAAVSRKFDQKPVLFEPRSILQAIAGADAADAYLRSLHPAHQQFRRLREALLQARQAGPAETGAGKPSADVRQLVANMERWRWLPPDLGAFHVWDSIPDQMTSVVDNGRVVLAEKIVVGKLDTPTPIFSADMQFVIFHPSWGVPPGMKMNELAPKLRNTGGGWFSTKPLASSVLNAHGLQVRRGGVTLNPDAIDWASADIRSFDFIQGPGPSNVLGIVKFRFPNRHDVYMHDTPERHLFGKGVRAFSHGCMRVQNPLHLAEVLLAHDKGWSADKIKDLARHGGEIRLSTPIPVHVTYFTLWVDDAGKLVHRPDIYGLDSRVVSALEGRNVQILSMGTTTSDEGTPRPPQSTRARSKERARSPAAPQASNPFNPFGNPSGN